MLPPFLSLPNSFPSRPLPAIRGNPSQSESAPQADPGSPRNSQPPSELIRSNPSQSEANRGIQAHAPLPERRKYFLPYQIQWLDDESPLRIMEKSRQVGVSYADAYDSVLKASVAGAKYDVWVSSRDETLARLYLEDCKYWASIYHLAALDLGEVVFDKERKFSAQVLEFKNGRRIYCLSSNPDAHCRRVLTEAAWHYRLSPVHLHGGGTTDPSPPFCLKKSSKIFYPLRRRMS